MTKEQQELFDDLMASVRNPDDEDAKKRLVDKYNIHWNEQG